MYLILIQAFWHNEKKTSGRYEKYWFRLGAVMQSEIDDLANWHLSYFHFHSRFYRILLNNNTTYVFKIKLNVCFYWVMVLHKIHIPTVFFFFFAVITLSDPMSSIRDMLIFYSLQLRWWWNLVNYIIFSL